MSGDARIGFFGGAGAFFSGLSFVVTRPRVWPWAAVPVLVALVVTVALAASGIALSGHELDAWAGSGGTPTSSTSGFFVAFLRVLVDLAVVLVALVLGFLLAQPLSGPALDRVVVAQERELGGAAPESIPLFAAVARSLRVTAVTLAVGTPPIVLLTLIELVFPPAAIVTWPLKLVVSALLATWNLVDYPFALRGVGIRARYRWFKEHLGACLGFGLVVATIALIPLFGLLVLPFGVAGATRLLAASARSPSAPRPPSDASPRR